MKNGKIKVLIIDDSALVRRALEELLSGDSGIEVIGTAQNPFDAAEKMTREVPDVITLDIEMPKMDGLTFLKKLMGQHPIPVVICSTLVGEGSSSALEAMRLGAVEVIQKPKVGTKQFFEESRMLICDSIKAAALAKPIPAMKYLKVAPKLDADAVLSKPTNLAMHETTDKVISVGASTGGTEALRVFLESMPPDAPGIIIVQHMPENFTRAFANRLNTLCRITVKEAENKDTVLRGRALIAPGNKHLLLKRSGAVYHVEVTDGPLVSRHRPSVDVLFRSTARYAGKNAIGVIMTGMGDDGAKGLLEMRESGALTLAQDEATSVVYGMPGSAVKLGAVQTVLPLEKIAPTVIQMVQRPVADSKISRGNKAMNISD